MLKVWTELIGDVIALRFSGKINIFAGDQILREAVDVALKGGAKKLLLDLAGVTYIDSAGMGELISAYKRVFVDSKIPFKIISRTTGRAKDILTVTRASDWLPIYTDEATAIASFK